MKFLTRPSMGDPSPYELEGDRGKALLLHGFTGTPYETRPIGDALFKQKVGSLAPLLPGHGADGAAINATTAGEWSDFAAALFQTLPKAQPRFVVGVSMGALLAIDLTRRFCREIDGIILLAPAFSFHASGQAMARAARAGYAHIQPVIPKMEKGGDLADREAQAINPSTPEIPLKALIELENLQKDVWPLLKNIAAPVFIAHGALDRTIPHAVSFSALSELKNARWVEYHRLPRSRHVLPLDIDRNLLMRFLSAFVESILSDHRSKKAT